MTALLMLSALAAPAEELIVGAIVMVREPAVPLKVVDKNVGAATLGQPFRVSVINGDWLGLSGQGYPFGFVQKKQVAGLDVAPEVFGAEIVKNPKNAAAWLARGTARRLRGEHAEALKDLDEAVRLAPTADTRIARGNLHRDMDQDALAWADYDAALKAAPKSPFARNNRGEVLFDRGDFVAAIAEYDAALKELPSFGLAMVNRGMARAKRGDHAGAIEDYNNAIKLNPLDASAQNAGAWLLATCKEARFRNGARAVEMAERACSLTSNGNAAYLDTLAAAHAEAGAFERALAALERARQHAPDAQKAELDAHAAKLKAKEPIRD